MLAAAAPARHALAVGSPSVPFSVLLTTFQHANKPEVSRKLDPEVFRELGVNVSGPTPPETPLILHNI